MRYCCESKQLGVLSVKKGIVHNDPAPPTIENILTQLQRNNYVYIIIFVFEIKIDLPSLGGGSTVVVAVALTMVAMMMMAMMI